MKMHNPVSISNIIYMNSFIQGKERDAFFKHTYGVKRTGQMRDQILTPPVSLTKQEVSSQT
jgi:hypothetical protein